MDADSLFPLTSVEDQRSYSHEKGLVLKGRNALIRRTALFFSLLPQRLENYDMFLYTRRIKEYREWATNQLMPKISCDFIKWQRRLNGLFG